MDVPWETFSVRMVNVLIRGHWFIAMQLLINQDGILCVIKEQGLLYLKT